MNYSEIKFIDVANGPGCRTSIFVSGCRNHCKDCFNKVAWDFNNGKEFTEETLDYILEKSDSPNVNGLSILGGEPLEPENQKGVLSIVEKFKEKFPSKTIWLWTGFKFEDIVFDPNCRAYTSTVLKIFDIINVVVDGPFELDKKDTLRFRGSSNQRIIDIRKTWLSSDIELWEDEAIYSSHAWNV